MDKEKAKRRVSFHSSRNEDIENSLWDSRFVRLFKGERGISRNNSAYIFIS
ncbi:hypothetical protein [Candidatus Enterococcus clewellii]|uniref:Uncharacterized protein n=1 Tax=Candidatus Enterococcus clewellii TaxID=1834193 RepID=A0A242JYN8_9ENTE|nr:hypothetical protein A5888_004009 [Enterococcus sp. 9E7_DIV0242]